VRLTFHVTSRVIIIVRLTTRPDERMGSNKRQGGSSIGQGAVIVSGGAIINRPFLF
jgi:hypothetical protein